MGYLTMKLPSLVDTFRIVAILGPVRLREAFAIFIFKNAEFHRGDPMCHFEFWPFVIPKFREKIPKFKKNRQNIVIFCRFW